MSDKTVQANLRLTRLEPWSTLRTGFLISISLAVTIITATLIFYIVLAGVGVFDAIDQLFGDILGANAGMTETFTLPVVFMGSIVIAGFEIIVTTALVGMFAYIYNLTVPFTGGISVTMAEDQDDEDEQN
jgi:ABC-type multidrug transport system permease subunit